MNSWVMIYILVASGGAVVTLLLTPVFRMIARKSGFMDCPGDNHKGHRKATALLGGLAMFTAWTICIVAGVIMVSCGVFPQFNETFFDHINGFNYAAGKLLFIGGATGLTVLLGLWDDKYALGAGTKFAGQFIVALIAVYGGGVKVNIFVDYPWLINAVSVFWIMLLMNSINFFDNMDGLAVGTIAIAMGGFSVIAALNAQYFFAVFSALNFGVCCGFWFYNASPATIFMGDSGSHFLGFLAAVVSAGVTCFDKGYSLSRFPILIPVLMLALPLFDTAMVVIIRTMNKKPFWVGDHNHISHRFVRMGLSRPTAVIFVHLMALSLALGTLPVYWGDFRTAAVLIVQAMILIGIITVLQLELSKKSDARE